MVSASQPVEPQPTGKARKHKGPSVTDLYNSYNTEFFKYDTKTSCAGPYEKVSLDGSTLLVPSADSPLVLLEPDDLALEYSIPTDSINVHIDAIHPLLSSCID